MEWVLCVLMTLVSIQGDCATPPVQPALAYGEGILEPPLWEREIVPRETTISVTWTQWNVNPAGLSALAHITYYEFPNVTIARLRAWVDDEWLRTVFADYRSWEITQSCREGGLSLYELNVVTSYGADYRLNYWVEYVDRSHFVDFMLAFPPDTSLQMAEYAARLFPELPACPEAR